MRKNGGWLVRFVLNPGDTLPDIQVQPAKGNLEDAYLRVIASAKNGGNHEN
jgi:hypothetical protein